jgi:hypothetical protein
MDIPSPQAHSGDESMDLDELGTEPPLEMSKADARDKCLEVLELMQTLGLTLPVLLDNICYGNDLCRTQGPMKKARHDLKESELLPEILDRLHTAPRTTSKGKRAPGAVEPLEDWAVSVSTKIFRREVLSFAKAMSCAVDEIVNEETLKKLTFQSILEAAEERAPCLLNSLLVLCEGSRSTKPERRMEKDSTFVSCCDYQVHELTFHLPGPSVL